MSSVHEDKKQGVALQKYISPASAWAISFGCIIGWGAFVMPGTTFLPLAGPLGTAIGMFVGAVAMLVIGFNYHFMMKRYPDAGGSFTFAKEVFGEDHGFLSAWFMTLAYVAILWANISALPLVGRNIFGDTFKVGYLYSIAGWDIYLGEVAIQLAVLAVFGCICAFLKRTAVKLQTVLAGALFLGIIASFVLVYFVGSDGSPATPEPLFDPSVGIQQQILGIVALAPWAFVGFESVSNSAEEFKFPVKKTLPIMVTAIIAGFLGYTILTFSAAAVQPEGNADWFEYVTHLGDYDGIEGLPLFYAMFRSGGTAGMVLLGIALVSAVLTGIVGCTLASARLMYSMSKDRILPKQFGKLSKDGNPRNAVLFIMLFSVAIPFLGRTAIGWVVDVITVGSTVAYGYTCAAAYKTAREEGNRKIMVTGIAGAVISFLIALLLLVPDLLSINTLSPESYLLLAFWAILGIVYFRYVFKRDKDRRFGSSTVVWVALLFLIFFTSLMWTREEMHETVDTTIAEMQEYYDSELEEQGFEPSEISEQDEEEHITDYHDRIHNSLTTHSVIQIIMIMFSLIIVFNIYSTLLKREEKLAVEKSKAEASSKAKTVFLSNMSHDIRTPMNAIIGYVTLAKKEDVTFEETKEYLDKIEGSSRHLLALINDVLEMSRIESGKIELEEEPCDLHRLMDEMYDMFSTQMSEKQIDYDVFCGDLGDRSVLCDKNRLNRVLLNLISNAYKFTPANGRVTVSLRMTGTDGETGDFELRVKDSGIGMAPEFADKVFDAFERERNSTVSGIQGTGLGMAITKSIIDIMGGTVDVVSAPGEGTEFIVRLTFRLSDIKTENASVRRSPEKTAAIDKKEPVFSTMRLLLVDDVMINREIAAKILRHMGFEVDIAVDGQEAVEKVKTSEHGYYNAVLMDIQMPVMDGYEATRTIRALDDKELADIPIIAMTANAFSEDVQKAKDAGMNAHVAKPIDINNLKQTLAEILM